MYANEDSRQMNTEHINAIRALLTAAKTKKLPNNMSSENDPRIDVQFAP